TKFNKTSIFSGLNNLADLTLSDQAATLLGLTLEELQHFFSDHIQQAIHQNTLSKTDFMQSMQDWYNGYRFSPHLPTRVYNPCSVIRCLLSGRFENHWSQTGTPSFLIKLIQEKDYPILDLENLIVSEEDLGTFDLDRIQLPTLLFQTGYLTIQDYDPRTKNFHLAYPNKEVSETMIKILAPILTGSLSFAPWQTLAEDLKDALRANDLDCFCSCLKSFFADIPYDLHIPLERYYQTVFYMLVKFMGADIMTEEKTNIGRIGAVFQTPTHTYIVEFKMGQSAQEALQQIEQKQYAQKYLLSGKSAVALGLAFAPKAKNIVDHVWKDL
ncbi:MAG: AAA family ATPase, partial [Myxococcaceae bacterium]|nr:AAA family ATPase [Myxococcaceae bacterium]